MLLEQGADVDKAADDGTTPLIVASQNGQGYEVSGKHHVHVVRILLKHGADVDKTADDGRTPLYIASQEGHVDVVRMLLEQGADIKKTWNGRTPKQIAKEGYTPQHTEIVSLLKRAALLQRIYSSCEIM